MIEILGFIDGVGFDPFFRGLLSVMVGVVVLCGSTYLLVASNSGYRAGGLISAAGFFGWMFLMGIVWVIYAIGWVGESETWVLEEILVDDAGEVDGLVFSEDEGVVELGNILESFSLEQGVDSDDPDVAQAEAVQFSRDQADTLEGWRYLATSDPRRGEATATAEEILIAEHIYDSATEYVVLPYGAWNTGGKPLLDPDISEDDPDKGAFTETFTDAIPRIIHKFDTTFIHFWHPKETMIIQVQGAIDEPALPGEAPPVAAADPSKSVVSVVMERDRGGPLPALIGGKRFLPTVFTIFNGILFALFCWWLHVRDHKEAAIRAAA